MTADILTLGVSLLLVSLGAMLALEVKRKRGE